MTDRSFLHWPFFEDRHRVLAGEIEQWAGENVDGVRGSADEDAASRALVSSLGRDGWLQYVVPDTHGGASPSLDVRTLCLIRETLARHWGLADFAFAMQGLGSAPITLSGSDDLRSRYLPRVASGSAVCAFALSEEGAGSDVSALETIAESDGSDYVLSGQKTWISNAGIADFYVIFARTGEEPGAKGLSAFVVDADTPGLEVSERIRVSSPHPLGSLRLSACRVPSSHRLGNGGDGFRIAMATLDVFRSTVAAAALGFSRRALQESVARVREREVFGRPLAEYQMIQQKIADMAATVDAGALLVYRAAWTKDQGAERVTREASIAKMMVTESAQRVIDDAVQIFGGLGVVAGHPVEELYRDIRPLRSYEGTTEIQKIVIAREVLKDNEEGT